MTSVTARMFFSARTQHAGLWSPLTAAPTRSSLGEETLHLLVCDKPVTVSVDRVKPAYVLNETDYGSTTFKPSASATPAIATPATPPSPAATQTTCSGRHVTPKQYSPRGWWYVNLPQCRFTPSASLRATCRLDNQRGARQRRSVLGRARLSGRGLKTAIRSAGSRWIQHYDSNQEWVKTDLHRRTRSPGKPTSAADLESAHVTATS
jgi:hypothetical protein